jgi:flagellar hook-associated protein 1 FlgK
LNAANTVAQQFQSAATGLSSQLGDLTQQTQGIIGNINQLASTIAQVNSDDRVDASGGVNAGVDAQLYSSLEQLSQYVNFTTLQQPDGTISVLVGGQTPLVEGDQAYDIQGDFSTQQTAILSSTGSDITSQITGGQLAAAVDDNNNVIPGYLTSLNTLAQSFADQVNGALDNGIDENGAAPTTDLFSYDPVEGAASTLTVNPLTTDQIAAALPGAPGGNGNALAVAQLANATGVDGYTFDEYFGNIGGQVGNDVQSATDSETTKQSLLTQAQTLRQQVSGVSLDSEAESLMAFQQSYEATSKMFTVLNELTETLMAVIT